MTSYKSPNTPLTTVSLFFVTNHNKAVGTFPHILNHIHKITYIPGDQPAACTALKPWKEIKALLWNLSLLSFFVLSTDKHTQRAYRSRFSEICFTNTHTHTRRNTYDTHKDSSCLESLHGLELSVQVSACLCESCYDLSFSPNASGRNTCHTMFRSIWRLTHTHTHTQYLQRHTLHFRHSHNSDVTVSHSFTLKI